MCSKAQLNVYVQQGTAECMCSKAQLNVCTAAATVSKPFPQLLIHSMQPKTLFETHHLPAHLTTAWANL
jgi:hypothetical protein